MLKTTSIAITCLLFLSSFSFHNDKLQISFKNSTGKDIVELRVWTIDSTIIIHDFKNGTVTVPYSVSSSYKFTHVNAVTDSGTFTTPGYCRTGEKRYDNGEMTMEFVLTSQTYTNSSKENPYLFINTTVKDQPVVTR